MPASSTPSRRRRSSARRRDRGDARRGQVQTGPAAEVATGPHDGRAPSRRLVDAVDDEGHATVAQGDDVARMELAR